MKHDFFSEMEVVNENEITEIPTEQSKNEPPKIVENDEISTEENQIADSSMIPDYVKLMKKISEMEETINNFKKDEVNDNDN